MKDVIRDPATLEALGEIAPTSADVIEDTVSRARQAQREWAALAAAYQADRLVRFADVVDDHRNELADSLTAEQGKPLADALAEVANLTGALRHFAPSTERPPEVIDQVSGQRVTATAHPLGVVAAIVPWNFPLVLLGWKLAPALAAGNAVIVKPAPSTPLTTKMLVDLADNVLPAGLVSMVHGGPQVGSKLISHRDVAKVSFTGSTPVGMDIMKMAADDLKPVTLELGGNDPAILLGDVDVEAVTPQLAHAAFRNVGQVCIAVKRLYVPEDRAADLIESLASHLRGLTLGHGSVEATDLGPVHSESQRRRVDDLVRRAQRDGARVITTATEPELPGWFRSPTLVTDVRDSAAIVAEEQFGPALPVLTYTDLDDAITRANRSKFGLGASVWSSDLERARAVASHLDAGTVWVNQHGKTAYDVPFGGWGHSGLGHELGSGAVDEYRKIRVCAEASPIVGASA